ncbi:chemotaxis protein CheA [bacterium]|nr:chemotaxis protein CheA [bacterium]
MKNTVSSGKKTPYQQKNIEAFKGEAMERLAELESALMELEKAPNDSDLIDKVFRAMHTIKGSSGMFGYTDIVEFTHSIETVFDKVRDGYISLTKDLIELSLKAHDQILVMLDDHVEPLAEDIQTREEVLAGFNNFYSQEAIVERQVSRASKKKQRMDTEEFLTYRIRFKPPLNIFSTGTNPLLLINELQDLGEIRVSVFPDNVPDLDQLNPEHCYFWWDIILNSNRGLNSIKDVFIFIEDICEISIEIIESESGIDKDGAHKRLGEILVERGDIDGKTLQQVLNNQERIGEKLKKQGLIKQSQIESALVEQDIINNIREKQKSPDTISSIRVTSTKLDKLVDLVGELVTAQARLSQITHQKGDSTILSVTEEIEHLTGELRDNTMSIRMLTFGTTFNSFKRLIRDLSIELNKDVIFTTNGAETELDKNMIEQLNDPLIHLLRNAMDHGIESPEIRIKKGKKKTGKIILSAFYSGSQVWIRIGDDGAGMDPEAIRISATEKGLINKNSKLSEKDCYSMVFEPGFSTASKVTNVSGRGVGMDIVKKAIENLRGSIDVDSKLDIGTTITLRLPLTLAIIDGLLVKVGESFYVLPSAAVKECIELTPADKAASHGRHIIRVRNQIIPYVRLREQFNTRGVRPEVEQIVVTEIESNHVGFVVDKVIGQHQTVIKNLSRVYKNVDTISGATIMADGTVALIIDINKHFQYVEKEYLSHLMQL